MVDNRPDRFISSHLGIIAGGGMLPQKLINSCILNKLPYTVIALKGHADSLTDSPSLWISLGEAGKAFDKMRERKVQDVVMVGKVIRPSLIDLRPDWRTVKFLSRVGRKAFINNSPIGDDNLLRYIISEIEIEGFNVIGLENLLSEFFVSEGLIGNISNSILDKEDINLGIKSAKLIGSEDRGQSVVIQGGELLLSEDEGGTDKLIKDSSKFKKNGPGPILVKMVKPNQDRRVDLPFIGVNTIDLCAELGFRGIVIEANGTLLGDINMIVERADKAGIFILAIECSKNFFERSV